jgi:hypothetical protein
MIQVSFQDFARQELILKAFLRSFTEGQVTTIDPNASVLVTDHWDHAHAAEKIIIFGKYPHELAKKVLPLHLAEIFSPSEKKYEIHFHGHPLTKHLHLRTRAFERFDFTNEWNNLGYGRIELDPASPFGISEFIAPDSPAGSAAISHSGIPYLTLFSDLDRAVLWVNRNVGPIDGFDWRVIEDFISDYRHASAPSLSALPCLPVLSEIPRDYQGAVTMRIDCDERIASGRPLFELYRQHQVPFSMAIKTQQEIDADSTAVMKEVLAAGGSIVTHSHTHLPNWGGSEDAAEKEVSVSLDLLKKALPAHEIKYAVSPFHQNPPYAVKGIAKAGIEAFVGGIIHNDPEYFFARAGVVPYADGIISHSQSCMLHGDCYHDAGNSLQIYFEAFQNALKTETFFGYLDHPFSNYQYGWASEEERLGVHDEYLKHLKKEKNIWFASLTETLDFLWDRAHTSVELISGKVVAHAPAAPRSPKKMKIRFKGENVNL